MTSRNDNMKFLKNEQIDFFKWDHCITNSSQCIIYGLSWYLNAVSPGWAALVLEQDGRYIAVCPLTIKRKLGLKYLAQPFATQQLGIFYIFENIEFIVYVLDFMRRKFIIIDYNFNSSSSALLPEDTRFKFISRITYCMKLNIPYSQTLEKFSVNHKRSIKKALKAGLKIRRNNDFETLIRLFRSTKGQEMKELNDGHYMLLLRIFKAAQVAENHCMLMTHDDQGNILAAGLFLIFKNRIIYLMGATTNDGRKQGAMHLIFEEIIKKYSGKDFILDFEGGEMEGIGRFYLGFGAEPEYYKKLLYSRFKFLRNV
jgi:hypothetical protein